jgi:type II secretory pathway pseudopilin PulG
MEQLVMVLVFALAAALCVQVFVLSDGTSRRNQARDQAVVQAQNAAETLKTTGGDLSAAAGLLGGQADQETLSVTYDETWTPCTQEEGVYTLTAQEEAGDQPGLGQAEIQVTGEQWDDPLFTLTVSWQEVTS